MFEDYLEDAHYFVSLAKEAHDSKDARRFYRAAVFCLASAAEAFVNFVGDVFGSSPTSEPYEVAFLTDKCFGVQGEKFAILDKSEFHKLEDKLRFLLCKYCRDFDFGQNAAWPKFLEFKRMRDQLTHPRLDEDPTEIHQYEQILSDGISATIELMNVISKGVFKRPLRRKLLDLAG